MLSDKKLAQVEKILGPETIIELQGTAKEALKDRLVGAESSIKQATQELEANPQYQETKENLKALSQGLRDVKKRQNAIIQYSLSLLEDQGE